MNQIKNGRAVVQPIAEDGITGHEMIFVLDKFHRRLILFASERVHFAMADRHMLTENYNKSMHRNGNSCQTDSIGDPMFA